TRAARAEKADCKCAREKKTYCRTPRVPRRPRSHDHLLRFSSVAYTLEIRDASLQATSKPAPSSLVRPPEFWRNISTLDAAGPAAGHPKDFGKGANAFLARPAQTVRVGRQRRRSSSERSACSPCTSTKTPTGRSSSSTATSLWWRAEAISA